MFYDFALTIPANTAQASPVTQELKLTAGIVHYVEIEFPSGCAGLAHVQIRQPEATYLPTNPDGSFHSDGHVIPIKEHLELGPGENTLKAVAWNLDDTYQHIVTVRIGVLAKEQLEPVTGLMALLQKFFRLVGVR
jgi:hypothetical protein